LAAVRAWLGPLAKREFSSNQRAALVAWERELTLIEEEAHKGNETGCQWLMYFRELAERLRDFDTPCRIQHLDPIQAAIAQESCDPTGWPLGRETLEGIRETIDSLYGLARDEALDRVVSAPSAATDSNLATIQLIEQESGRAQQKSTLSETDQLGETLRRIGLAAMDSNTGLIIQIAGDRAKSAEQRAREICDVDARFWGKNSPFWAELLGVSDAAIRKTDFWKVDRRKYLDGAREDWREAHLGEAFPEWLPSDD
jgi:hypothetical protein